MGQKNGQKQSNMVKYGQKMKKKKSNERRETIEHVGGRKILILGHFSPEKYQKMPVCV